MNELELMADEIARLSTAIDQTTQRQLTLLRDFDERGGWASSGATSCAAWLSWRTGLTPGPARERMRVAHKLGGLPLIDAAFATGELSYSKIRALTRIADAESEALLLEQARLMTGAQLEKLVASLRRTDCETADPQRFFRQRTCDDGMVRITVQLTADEAAAVTAALDAVADQRGQRAEALVAIADERLRGNAPDRSPTEVVVHVDASDLEGPSAQTCRRLLCDAGVVPVFKDGNRLIDVGRKTRTVPTSVRRALAVRDDGCQFPGCDNHIVDAHHIEHWANGGETTPDNLVSLCRRHHRFVHEGGATVTTTDAGFEFRGSRGDVMCDAPRRPPAAPLAIDHIDPLAGCAKNTNPDPIDWPYVIDAVGSNLR